jgi:monoamine oxidase
MGRHRIAIVGAGVSGLATAHLLCGLGHEVVLFEARQRPGGRILTLRQPFSDGLWADAGALRIADNHLHTHDWARHLGLTLEPVYPHRGRLVQDTPAGARRGEETGWLSSQRVGQILSGHRHAQSAAKASRPKRLRRLMRESLFEPTWSRISGGMDKLPHTLARALHERIRYGAVVHGIEQRRNEVRVRYADGGQDHAPAFDRVVMATPHTTLRDIAFEPPLSAPKYQAMAEVANVASIRFFFQLADRDWLSSDLCGYGATSEGMEVWQPVSNARTGRCLLVLSAQRSAAPPFVRLGREARMERVRQRAQDLFPAIASRIEREVEVCWSEDPWCHGAQSRIDQSGIARSDLAAAEGRVHFAGEFTTNNWIDGALQSAHRVVAEIAHATADTSASRANAARLWATVAGTRSSH